MGAVAYVASERIQLNLHQIGFLFDISPKKNHI
jgi:hypothetical protein